MPETVKPEQKPEEKPELKPWQLANGNPKPEYTIALKSKLSDGTDKLHLAEPNVKTIRRSRKMLEFTDDRDPEGNRTPTEDSALVMGVALVAGVTGISDDVLEELPGTTLRNAIEYLSSFT